MLMGKKKGKGKRKGTAEKIDEIMTSNLTCEYAMVKMLEF